jgi:DNA polymerase III delta prime subunit
MEKLNTIPWVEKYRPTQFDTIVLDPLNRELFKNILEKNYFPNLLFYGPPGTGKTTTIINLINEFQAKHYKINKNLVIHLNASDERGIDIIRNQIQTFVKTKNLFDTGLKFVILDEVDYMTKNAQQALKYLLQTCSNNIKFCLICNYISKIEESLQDEFICIRFNQLPKPDIHNFIKNISINEELNLNDDSIDTIQNMYHSDIRSMVNFIQLNQSLKSNEFNIKIINNNNFEIIHKMLMNTNSNPNDIILYIHELSREYNIDKKTIIHNYFNYIIRNKPKIIQKDILNIMTNLIHNTDVKIEQCLNYFCYQLHEYYSTNI